MDILANSDHIAIYLRWPNSKHLYRKLCSYGHD